MKVFLTKTLFLSFIIRFYDCRKASEMTNGALMTQLHKKGIYQKLEEYGQGVSITQKSAPNSDTTFALLEEISYGHKPAYVRFTQKVKSVDFVLIRQAVIDLVNRKI